MLLAASAQTCWLAHPDNITAEISKNIVCFIQILIGKVDQKIICDRFGSPVYLDIVVKSVTQGWQAGI
jgi:hypothetical protein